MANPTGASGTQQQQAQKAAVPFLAGSWEYSEWMAQDSLTMGNSTEYVHQITPGGFLRGITFSLTSASGVLGTTASLVGDSPWSVIQSMTL